MEDLVPQVSPYTPGEVTSNALGRSTQLAYFLERIDLMTRLGQITPRIRVDYASRGIGKTSLLRTVERRMHDAGIRTVWVTANPAESLAAGILVKLQETASPVSRLWNTLKASIETATVSLGVPNTASASLAVRTVAHEAPNAADAFKKAIIIATEAIEADGARGLAIFVDEIQAADRASVRVIANAWQELYSERYYTPAGIFMAGLPNSSEEINKAATSSERFEYRPLPGLQEQEAELVLHDTAAGLGVRWTVDALELGARESQGYPHKVQLLGDETWLAAGNPDAGHEIGIEDVRRALPAVEQQMEELFRARWNPAAPSQKAMMRAIAELGGIGVERRELAAKLGKTTFAISNTRAKLLERGIVESERHGLIGFSAPGFAHWILSNEMD